MDHDISDDDVVNHYEVESEDTKFCNDLDISEWSSNSEEDHCGGNSSSAVEKTSVLEKGACTSEHVSAQMDAHSTDVTEVTTDEIENREFLSEDEAYNWYVKYAWSIGFGVRKSDLHRDFMGQPTRRKFVCTRAGLRSAKHYTRVDRKRDHRAETRTNCKSKLMIHRDSGSSIWRVRRLIEEHNHELIPQNFIHLIPNHRHISEGDMAQIDTMHSYGMQTSQIFGFMAGQSGGYGCVGFSKKDLYNYIVKQRQTMIVDGDAAAAISYLQGKADADGVMVARYTTLEDDSLGNLFWADGLSRVDYEHFGDVVAFDPTYKKNKYNKPLVIFSGANHHRQTCIFGFSLLGDERTETYQWLLEQFLDVMGNKQPNVVVTDGDDAMREAIRRVFPNARHRLCAWHLERNATTNIKDPEFYAAFKKCIYGNFDVEQFEQYWHEVIQRHGLSKNRWVRSTYDKKEMWASTYLKGTFCAGIRTTSRCEGINSFIKRFIKSKFSILQLVQSLERVVQEYRNNELQAQFSSSYTTLVPTTGLHSIEEHAAKTYTRSIFKQVRLEMEKISSLIYVSSERITTCVAYKMCKFGNPTRMYEVMYDRNGDKDGATLECKCNFWQTSGIPCSHMFFVMKHEHIRQIPNSLIKKRWCKDVKSFQDDGLEDESHRTQILRYGALAAKSSWMSFLASKSRSGFVSTMNAMQSIIEDLEVSRGVKRNESTKFDGRMICDPEVTKTKGAPKKHKFDSKKRCCSNCGHNGHTKRTCTEMRGDNIGGTKMVVNDPISESLNEHAQPSFPAPKSSDVRYTSVHRGSFKPTFCDRQPINQFFHPSNDTLAPSFHGSSMMTTPMFGGIDPMKHVGNVHISHNKDRGHVWYLQQFLGQQPSSNIDGGNS